LAAVPGLNLLKLKEIVDELALMLSGAVDGIDELRGAQP